MDWSIDRQNGCTMKELFGQRLREQRIKHRLTLEQLAERLGWTKSYCSLILNSKRKPRGIREKMEAAVSELIKEKEDKTA